MNNFIMMILTVIILLFIALYNSLTNLKKRSNNCLEQMNIQYNKRHDMLPELMNILKQNSKSMKKEINEIEIISEKALNIQDIDIRQKIEGKLTRLLDDIFIKCASEEDINAREDFNKIKIEFDYIRTSIDTSREFYNELVTRYNSKLKSFPMVVIAFLFRIKPIDCFSEDTKFEIETNNYN